MYNTKYTYTYSFLEQRSGVYTERSRSNAWGRPRDPILGAIIQEWHLAGQEME
jgi:hypothetical protein